MCHSLSDQQPSDRRPAVTEQDEKQPADLSPRQVDTATANHDADLFPLSPTEEKVLNLLLKRMTEQEVADHLGRSSNTVHVHVRNIYRKLRVKKRAELFQLRAPSND